MAKTVLPKDVKMPNFTPDDPNKEKDVLAEAPVKEDKKAKKAKEVEETPEVKEEQPKVEEKKAETKKEEKPAEAKPQNLPDNIEDYEYLLKPMQPMLKGWRVFLPYFFAFLYNLLLLVALAGLFVLPIVKLATPLPDEPKFPIDIMGMLGMADKFTGLNSIAEIAYVIVMSNIKNGASGILVAASEMFGFVGMAIFLVIMVIWFVIKFIHSLIALISIIFRRKRHKVIDNFFFKNTHQYFGLGILDFDFTYIVFFIYTVILWGLMNAKALLGLANIEGKTKEIIDGIIVFRAFENTDFKNFGNICLIIVFGALLVFRIIYRIIVKCLSRKVKKMYVLKKKKAKKDKAQPAEQAA